MSGVFSTILTNTTQSVSQLESQSTAPQIILAAGTQASGSLPLQQLLIPVSAGSNVSSGGIQQLISVPVPVGAASATGQMQLLATPGGQLINVASTPHLNVALPSPGLLHKFTHFNVTVSRKTHQLIFCSASAKYEPISIKIGRHVPE